MTSSTSYCLPATLCAYVGSNTKTNTMPPTDTGLLAVNSTKAIEQEVKWLSDFIDTRMKMHWGNECAYTNVHEVLPPDLLSQLLDSFTIRNSNTDHSFTKFGVIKGKKYSGLLPTGETAAFVLCGNDLHERLKLLKFFNTKHFFFKENILKPVSAEAGEPFLSSVLGTIPEYLAILLQTESSTLNVPLNFQHARFLLNWNGLIWF